MVARKKNTGFETEQGKPIPLGVNRLNGDMNFAAAVPNVKECRLNLYHRITGNLADSILLTDKHRTGNVFSVLIKDFNPQDYSYMYQTEKKEFIDPYARIIYGKEDYGKRLTTEEKSLVRGGFLSGEYNWQDQRNTPLPYSELIVYKMNIRGFTKHSSSKVQNKGTFLGLLEKLPYLVELGINCIQLMPIYEFNEIIEYSGFGSSYKLNYWGYSPDNSYFAPKAAYASNPGQADLELKDMVNTLHQNGIEVIMEMNFANNDNPVLIQDCLRYWAMEYHIDGFKINCDTVSASLLALDPVLGRTKLLAAGWNCNQLYEKDYEPIYKNLAEYNDGYSVDVKRFLKADEDMVGPFAFRLRQNSNKYSMVNYITNHDGFTLMDLYSYDRKHNEANGENNHDGASYNYSWNCGEEGKTKKKKVLDLRKKQIKNAFSALLFSQGTPLILAGDEFGNTQSGNSNAYCQDNEISWLNWSLLKNNADIYEFVRQLIQIRKEHPILHMEFPLKNMDYISCGFPDLSFHGTKAWYPDFSPYNRMLGVLLSGRYAKRNRKEDDCFFYFVYNMHWEKHEFHLPKLPDGLQWYVLFETVNSLRATLNLPLEDQKQIEAVPRSVIGLIGK